MSDYDITVNVDRRDDGEFDVDVAVEPKLNEDPKNVGPYEFGSLVQTPDGMGAVVERVTSVPDHEKVPDNLSASEDNPLYAVVMGDGRHGSVGNIAFYHFEQLDSVNSDISSQEAMQAFNDGEDTNQNARICARKANGDWTPPETWRESETPARLIAMKAFQSMGGDFDGCTREMSKADGITDDEKFCAAFLDYIFGHTYWRGDSMLPGA